MSTPSKPSWSQYVWHPNDPASRKKNKNLQVRAYDGGLNDSAVPTWAGDVYLLSSVAAGNAMNERQALRIKPVHFEGRFQTSADGDYMLATSQEIRVIIFQDLQQVSDSKTTVDDVLESLNDRQVTLTPAYDKDVPGKVRIYHDRVYSWGFNSPSSQLDEFTIDGGSMLPISFNGTSSSDIQKNGLYLLVVSSTSTSPTPANYWPPGFNFRWRLQFHSA